MLFLKANLMVYKKLSLKRYKIFNSLFFYFEKLVLEATVTSILNVIKVTHNSSNIDKTLISKKSLIIRLQYYVIEFRVCPLVESNFFLNF